MTLPRQGVFGGYEYLQMAKIGAGGIPYGTAGAGGTAPYTTSAQIIDHVVQHTPPPIPRATAQLRGGNRSRGTIQFGVTDPGQLNVTMQDFDGRAWGITDGVVENTTINTRRRFFFPQHGKNDLGTFMLMHSTILYDSDEGSDGITRWVHTVYPRCQGDIQIPDMNFQSVADTQLNFTTQLATRNHLGEPFTTIVPELVGGRCFFYVFFTDNPVYLTTHVSATSTNTFSLPFLPISTTVTQTYNYATKNGVATAPTTVNIETGAVGITGLDNDVWVIEYETDRVAA